VGVEALRCEALDEGGGVVGDLGCGRRRAGPGGVVDAEAAAGVDVADVDGRPS
jgi:hypothetical protein